MIMWLRGDKTSGGREDGEQRIDIVSYRPMRAGRGLVECISRDPKIRALMGTLHWQVLGVYKMARIRTYDSGATPKTAAIRDRRSTWIVPTYCRVTDDDCIFLVDVRSTGAIKKHSLSSVRIISIHSPNFLLSHTPLIRLSISSFHFQISCQPQFFSLDSK